MSDLAYFNRKIIHQELVTIGFNDRGLTLGDGVFETIPVVNFQPLHLRLHLDRLQEGLAVFGIAPNHGRIKEC